MLAVWKNYADGLIYGNTYLKYVTSSNYCKIVLKYQRIFFPLSSFNFMLGLLGCLRHSLSNHRPKSLGMYVFMRTLIMTFPWVFVFVPLGSLGAQCIYV